jgi:hypothetical protein
MTDVWCPYCDKPQEINHDDGYGYSEDQIFQQQCGNCHMVFSYTTSISFHYDAEKAACLNGGDHEWVATFTRPVEFTRMRCTSCGDERKPTPDEMAALVRTVE